ncbi:MAG: glycosyltransferase WbuB, partial [Chloroflexi bacterium]|nr:glycosyltransferase WbuB [Chloroflexota bacterium]
MRIWILTQFYPPEFGAAAIRLSRLARLLAADGHAVTVLTGMPNYPAGVIPPESRGRVFCRGTLVGVNV